MFTRLGGEAAHFTGFPGLAATAMGEKCTKNQTKHCKNCKTALTGQRKTWFVLGDLANKCYSCMNIIYDGKIGEMESFWALRPIKTNQEVHKRTKKEITIKPNKEIHNYDK